MERFRFDPDAAFTADQELVERVTIAPLGPPGELQAAMFRVSADSARAGRGRSQPLARV